MKPGRPLAGLSTISHPQKITPRPCGDRLSIEHSARKESTVIVIGGRVKTDKRSGIVNDPNRADDPQYILRIIGKVISVSLETVKVVEGLPELGIDGGVLDGEGVS